MPTLEEIHELLLQVIDNQRAAGAADTEVHELRVRVAQQEEVIKHLQRQINSMQYQTYGPIPKQWPDTYTVTASTATSTLFDQQQQIEKIQRLYEDARKKSG